ncbi:MAG TPA: Ig-like domain-containing protein [Polyangiaceae bacterium]|nr:Ig-like domain-containing protein [Polyangiaceae bacterium]
MIVRACVCTGLLVACVPQSDWSSFTSSEAGAPGENVVRIPSPSPSDVTASALPGPPEAQRDAGGALPSASGARDAAALDPLAADASMAMPSETTGSEDVRGAVAGTIPADGARGVLPDTQLVIDFGRPMSTASVPAAIVGEDVLLEGAAFDWNAEGSVVRITLAAPLALARGEDPSRVSARCHAYHISDAALDARGLPILPASVRFCSVRRISQSLAPIGDSGLTGNFRSDGSVGDGNCAPSSGFVCVGDSGFAANAEYRGFLTFDASSVAEPVAVLAAELRVALGPLTGNPFADLGSLLVEATRFAAIDATAFAAVAAGSLGELRPTPGDESTLSSEVAPALLGPALDGRVQLRLRFASATDRDGTSDHILARSSTLSMRVDYLTP